MRKKVEHYSGTEITEEVIAKINLISLERYREGLYSLIYEGVDTLEELSYWSDAEPEEMNILLGEDWFIVYSKKEDFIEINEWLSIETVPNKFTQTMEMFNSIKSILLSSEIKKFRATMKHNTSYKFYSDFIKRGYLQEYYDSPSIESNLPNDLDKIKNNIESQYEYIEDFLNDENRNKEQEEKLEDYIYHDIVFGTTNKFINRYKK